MIKASSATRTAAACVNFYIASSRFLVQGFALPSSRLVGSSAVPEFGVASRRWQQTVRLQMTKDNSSSSTKEPRKAGVASPEQLQALVDQAGDRLIVVDTRNPDASVEPGDQKSLAVAGLPSDSYRPRAVHLPWDRTTQSMPLLSDNLPFDTPIITHCGGGGRGQLAKEYLEQQGFTNVLNGGGPKETECWAVYGDK